MTAAHSKKYSKQFEFLFKEARWLTNYQLDSLHIFKYDLLSYKLSLSTIIEERKNPYIF